jgi:acetylxylan esterase
MRRLFNTLCAAGLLVASLALASPVHAASLTQVTNFGNNPSGLNMYVYVPNNVAARPALLVAIHYCTGSASALYSGYFHDYVTAADQYGYVIVFPEATRSGQCFDVYSPQALTRGGGSDPVGIISMVNYAKQHYNVDSSRVFVSGVSSGAMMTNVMAAEYPDVFAAGSAFMGVPATCFATTGGSTWNSDCANGNITKTAQQWGDAARAMGGSGTYPRMQLWHGTADTTLNYHNFGEEIKQWTNLKGVSQTPVLTDSPQSGWTRTRYGSNTVQAPVEGISVSGAAHVLPQTGMVGYAISFLGLNSTTPPPPTPTPTALVSSTPSRTASPTPIVTASPIPTPSVTPVPSGVAGAISINSGGSATGSFLADQYSSGGSTVTNTNTIDLSQITSNPPPAAVFQSERYGAFNYTIPNRTAGSAQTVTLYFAETYVTASGQRIFNVTINGTTVLTNFDIYAAAGGQNRAIARTFGTTANSSGQVVIGFISGTQNPKINGITVASGGVTPTPTPIATATPAITPSPTPVRTASPVITPTATPVITPTATPVITPTATPVITPTATPVITPTATPVITPPPSGGAKSCSGTLHVDNSWSGGFQATVTVTNTGTGSTAGWRVTWTWLGSQSIVNYWNAALTSSGSSVTATNLSYNGAIAAGGNTTFGFQASFSGTNATPTLSCSAT